VICKIDPELVELHEKLLVDLLRNLLLVFGFLLIVLDHRMECFIPIT
jgi:hypothetical protein